MLLRSIVLVFIYLVFCSSCKKSSEWAQKGVGSFFCSCITKNVVRRCVDVTSMLRRLGVYFSTKTRVCGSGYTGLGTKCHTKMSLLFPSSFPSVVPSYLNFLQVILALLSCLVFCCCLCCVSKRDEDVRKKGAMSLADKDQDKASVMTTHLRDDGDEVSSVSRRFLFLFLVLLFLI